jgi:vitamin B12 transporter
MVLFRSAALLICGLLCCDYAFSQTSTTPADDELNTIVVTASRSPLARVELGNSMSVITREQIDRRQARYVTDLLRAVPGVSVSQSGTTGSQTQVRIRGAEANHVLVLIDGVRANDPGTGDEFRWELLSTNNIERIEIVRGPQSSLWGSDAVAAVVHVITRAESDQSRMGAYAESASHNTLNAGVSGVGRGDSWSLGYGLERLDTDGTNISRTGDELDDSNIITANLSGKFHPTEAMTLSLGLRSVDAYSQFDPTDFFVTGLPVDADVATDTQQTFLHFGGVIGSPGKRVTHQLLARFLDANNMNLIDGITDSSTESNRLTLGYQADFLIGETPLSLAFEHERTRFEQRGQIGFGDPNQTQETHVNSVMADYQGKSFERLAWLLNLRYDNYSDFKSALTGRISLTYELTDATKLRANVGTGQKTPTFTDRFGFFPGQFIGNPSLKPEQSTSFDIGIEQSFLNDAVQLELTVFDQDLENEIDGFVFDPNTFLFSAENITGSSSRKGVEFAALFNVTHNLSLTSSYTYIDSSATDVQGHKTRELRRPHHTGNLTANIDFLDDRFNLTVIADYGGSQTDIFFPPFPASSEIIGLGSYWLLDVAATYELSPAVDLFARITNMLDEDYEQVFGYQTPGRAGYFGVRVNFGR